MAEPQNSWGWKGPGEITEAKQSQPRAGCPGHRPVSFQTTPSTETPNLSGQPLPALDPPHQLRKVFQTNKNQTSIWIYLILKGLHQI